MTTMANRYANQRPGYPFFLFALLALLSGPCLATMAVFADPHAVLTQAIRTGSASGAMAGPVAEHFTRQFRSTGPLLVNAKVIQHLANADCKRLEMVFTQRDVDTPKGRTEAILTTKLDYCLDGGSPATQKVAP